eukprot:Opistho-2@35961
MATTLKPRIALLIYFAIITSMYQSNTLIGVHSAGIYQFSPAVPLNALTTDVLSLTARGPSLSTEQCKLIIAVVDTLNSSSILAEVDASPIVAADGGRNQSNVTFPPFRLYDYLGALNFWSLNASAIVVGVRYGPSFVGLDLEQTTTSVYNATLTLSILIGLTAPGSAARKGNLTAASPLHVFHDDVVVNVVINADAGSTDIVTLIFKPTGASNDSGGGTVRLLRRLSGAWPTSQAVFSGVDVGVGYYDVSASAVYSRVLTVYPRVVAVYPRVLEIGGIFPRNMLAGFGDNAEVGARIAVEMINNSTELLPFTTVSFSRRFASVCSKLSAAGAVLNVLRGAECGGPSSSGFDSQVHAIVGAACSSEATSMVPIASVYKVPVISYGAASTELSNRALYPLFARTHPSTTLEGVAALAMAVYFKWRDIAVISMDTFAVSDKFASIASLVNVSISANAIIQDKPDGSGDYWSALHTIALTGTHVIACFAYGPGTGKALLKQAVDMGLVGSTYTWILGFGAYDSTLWPIRFESYNATHTYMDLFSGSLGSRVSTFGGNISISREVAARWNSLNLTAYAPENKMASSSASVGANGEPIGGLALTGSLAFDAVHVLARAYHRLAYEQGKKFADNGDAAFSLILQSNFQGIGGQVLFDANGDTVLAKRRTIQLRSDPSLGPTDASKFYVAEWGLATQDLLGVPMLEGVSIGTDSRGWVGMQWNGFHNDTPKGFSCSAAMRCSSCVGPNKCGCVCEHGVCTPDGACQCDFGYSGAICSVYVGVASGSSGVSGGIVAVIAVLPTVAMIFGVGFLMIRFLASRKRLEVLQKNVIELADIQIHDEIASGSFGTVYRGQWHGLPVALKVLHVSLETEEPSGRLFSGYGGSMDTSSHIPARSETLMMSAGSAIMRMRNLKSAILSSFLSESSVKRNGTASAN